MKYAVKKSILLLSLLSAACPVSLHAQATWSGAGGDDNWSTAGNWAGGVPSGNIVLFNNTNPTTSGVVNNVVDSSLTIDSLTYSNTGANWQVTEITAGQTLTIDAVTPGTNAFWVGTAGASSTYQSTTNVEIGGDGSLAVIEPTANFLVSSYSTGGGGGTTANSVALLDLSGLSELEADVNLFTVGSGRGANGTLHLASTNAITANVISVGRSEWNGSSGSQSQTSSAMFLGQTNTLGADDLLIGSNLLGSTFKNANSGTLAFDSGLSGTPTVTIRGKDGVSAVTNMVIANIGGDAPNGTGGPVTNLSEVDFTGGSVDALVGTLTVGTGSPASGSAAIGEISMDEGVFVANAVFLGRATGNSSPSALGQYLQGTLNVAGGAFTANSMALATQASSSRANTAGYVNVSGGSLLVTGNVTMGDGNSLATGTAEINLTGGSLRVEGNIAEGSGTNGSTVNLSGGDLDMDGGTITVDTLTLQSGTLRNLAQFNAGGTLTKTTVGTLVIEGSNAYTGTTVVSAGTLLINGTTTASQIEVNDGAVLGGTGTIQPGSGKSLTVVGNGTVAPGVDGSVGMLSVNLVDAGAEFETGAEFVFELGIPNTGDQMAFLGLDADVEDVVFNDNVINFVNLGGLAPGTYTLFTFNADNAYSGTLAIGTGLESFGGGSISYNADSIVLTVVPEPAAWLLFGLGSGFLLARRRRARME